MTLLIVEIVVALFYIGDRIVRGLARRKERERRDEGLRFLNRRRIFVLVLAVVGAFTLFVTNSVEKVAAAVVLVGLVLASELFDYRGEKQLGVSAEPGATASVVDGADPAQQRPPRCWRTNSCP